MKEALARLDALLTAPHASPVDRVLGYGAGVIGAGFALVVALTAELPTVPVVVLALFGFDLFGGAVINATESGSRRFHGKGMRRWPAVGFVACHVHPLVLAVLLPALMPWASAIVAYLALLACAFAVASMPASVRQPVAFLLATVTIALIATAMPPDPFLAWVVPVLAIKLLLSHLLPHPVGASW